MILAELGWPGAVVFCIFFITMGSCFMGTWPWQRDIYYECDKRGCERDDEETDDKETK